MLELSDYILLALFGSFGAFLSGFLGVGGGLVYIPVLDYFLSKMGLKNDVLVKAILANSLFTIIFSGSLASYKQYKMGNFYPKEILKTALPGMLSALVLTYFIQTGNWYSKQVFNYVFALMLFIIIIRMFAKKPVLIGEQLAPTWKYLTTGFFAGLITAFSGLGGGVVMTPLFTDWMKQSIKKASSISNGVIPMFAIVMGIFNLSGPASQKISNYQYGNIYFEVIFPMILATFFFAPLGVKMAQRTSPKIIRIVFACFVSGVLLKLLFEILRNLNVI